LDRIIVPDPIVVLDPIAARRLPRPHLDVDALKTEYPMPHHPAKTATGKVTHLFGHRFVLKTAQGDILADLTPHGLDQIALRLKDEITIEGEMKPSELKVERLTRDGTTIWIEHHHPHHDHHERHHPPADPSVAVAAARDAGFDVLGAPRRKPKHFEVLGKKNSGIAELHVELDGHIRKSKPVEKDDHKWADELRGVS
jgi:hypothetical protein